MTKIRIGIVGYGNLGKGVESAVKQNSDIELIGIFTRRNPESLEVNSENVDVFNVDKAEAYIDKIDVMILCGGSANDLPIQGPKFASMYNTVDSYDNHKEIPNYYKKMNQIAEENDSLSAISIGWDPGLFSINRILASSILPQGQSYTFWGKGVSQGHSDAIRQIEGVKDAVQYTVPIKEIKDRVKEGKKPDKSPSKYHRRECYVVVEKETDKNKIRDKIKNMPNYFKDYETKVYFVDEEELQRNHSTLPHGGFVIRSGKTGIKGKQKQIYEFSLDLDSNPEFTASVLIAYSRAVYKLNNEGISGAKTVLDIPIGYLSPQSNNILREKYI